MCARWHSEQHEDTIHGIVPVYYPRLRTGSNLPNLTLVPLVPVYVCDGRSNGASYVLNMPKKVWMH